MPRQRDRKGKDVRKGCVQSFYGLTTVLVNLSYNDDRNSHFQNKSIILPCSTHRHCYRSCRPGTLLVVEWLVGLEDRLDHLWQHQGAASDIQPLQQKETIFPLSGHHNSRIFYIQFCGFLGMFFFFLFFSFLFFKLQFFYRI